ncbi:twitching motility protein PilT [Chryseotalea sanaruensis]|uniref:Twitching motility protein PilT n=1 Tax=Chryseotalea sanaruensis TaxID=2482724 RepID=A0A401UCD3_9BACT|nr:PIN domain-containing protein [Chryseotalea sanaruensis]GCC52553.1 twitching motility protein PilT [Chryseotalea sanaruensis]
MLPILVDSSVWIAFINNQESRETTLLTDLLTEENTICTCPLIFQEVLDGIADNRDFERIKKNLETFDLLYAEPFTAAIEAANIYRLLRKNGVPMRKSNDCLIAYYAIFNNAYVLQKDGSFEQIAKYFPLKLL